MKHRKKSCWALLFAMLLLVCGCGGTTRETVSMYDLCQAMEAADDSLPKMLYASSEDGNADELFIHISDMEYDKTDSFFVSYSQEGKADEIAVIAVKDESDVDEAKKSLEDHRSSRIKLLSQYEPEEVRRMEEGIVFSRGRYAVLIICEDPDSVRKAFEDMVK